MARPPSIYPLLFTDSLRVTGKDSGVYGIQNRNNLKIYIGSSINLNRRKEKHKNLLRNRKHCSVSLLKEFWESPESFEFVTIELADKSRLKEREQFWLDFYKPYLPEFGYNQSPSAHSLAGIKRDDAYKKMMSIAQTGLKKKSPPPRTAEYIEKQRVIGLANRGKNVHPMKPVIQCDLQGNAIKRFECVSDVARELGKSSAAHVFSVLGGRRKTAYGYKWRVA